MSHRRLRGTGVQGTAVGGAARPERDTTKIALCAIKRPRWPGYNCLLFNRLGSKFVTWRINRISRSINELKPPYQPKNNGICDDRRHPQFDEAETRQRRAGAVHEP